MLEPQQCPVFEPLAQRIWLTEARQKKLRVEVVLIEDELHTTATPEPRQQPIRIRRVARLDDVEVPMAPYLGR
jgi:hypothetical protein